MQQLLTGWARRAFFPQLHQRQQSRARLGLAEALEERVMLDVTLSDIAAQTMAAGKDLYVPLTATDTTNLPTGFDVQSSNPNVTATVLTGGRSLRINVTGVDANDNEFTGDLTFRLFEDLAPNTTARIIQLAQSGFYNDVIFHRIIPGFIAQGGDPHGTGQGGSGTTQDDEFNTHLTFTSQGLLAMANAGDDTGDSQFFITDPSISFAQEPQHLNFNHTIFGILTDGFDTFQKIMHTPTTGTVPNDPPVINSATVFTDTQNGVLQLSAPDGFNGTSTITVTANDGFLGSTQKTFTTTVMADAINDRAFLGTVGDLTTNEDTPIQFTVQGIDLEKDPLTFVVKDPTGFGANDHTSVGTAPQHVSVNIQVTPASGNTPSSALITLTPEANFHGVINMVVGVRDNVAHTNGVSPIDAHDNFDTQQFSLTVNAVNDIPTATAGTTTIPVDGTASITLTGNDGDPADTQTLTYEIVQQPTHGAISNFNPAAGTLTYTPTASFMGTDSFTFRVHDNGGTANGGQDTSTAATFTINVGVTVPLAPTSVGLGSGTGNTISNPEATIVVAAEAGKTVKLLINGTTMVDTTETSPGHYTATLGPNQLQLGANTITATATDAGGTSDPSTTFTLNYAPSFQNAYTVPGAPGSSQSITFEYTSRQAAYKNEIGVYIVDGLDGNVGGVLPGSPGYAQAVLNSPNHQVLFNRNSGPGATQTLSFTGGQLLAFYIIANHSSGDFLDDNPDNGRHGVHAYFSFDAANPDHVRHVQTVADPLTAISQMGWEDLFRGGDHDFNDAVISVKPAGVTAQAGEAIRVPGDVGQTLDATVTLESTDKAAGSPDPAPPQATQGEFGTFVVDDPSGTIGSVHPGDPTYLQAVLSGTHQVLFDSGEAIGAQHPEALPGGKLIGFYYTPGSTLAQVAATNATNSATGGNVAFFSFDAANPSQVEHFRLYGPEGRNSPISDQNSVQVHVMDELFGNSKNFDDFLFSIDFPH
jgi:cyclophilin family peptidyl-prolyl cis-trans isomerase